MSALERIPDEIAATYMQRTPSFHRRSGRKAMGIATLHPSYGLGVAVAARNIGHVLFVFFA
jgi:hypothetical protein